MQLGKKIVCVLPSYNAAKTVKRTLENVPTGIVDLFILVDDCSGDNTISVVKGLSKKYPLKIFRHEMNQGYGSNQKTCYRKALEEGADIIVMLHPDYQYEPRLLGVLTGLVASGVYDAGLGSRILGKGALQGGMPFYKYFFNRVLTFIENVFIGQKLSEYHTGYRAFSRAALEGVLFEKNSDDFVFDNEILVQLHIKGFKIGEISVPTQYFPEASSISFWRSLIYGFGVLRCTLEGSLARAGIYTHPRFKSRNSAVEISVRKCS